MQAVVAAAVAAAVADKQYRSRNALGWRSVVRRHFTDGWRLRFAISDDVCDMENDRKNDRNLGVSRKGIRLDCIRLHHHSGEHIAMVDSRSRAAIARNALLMR
jgi:hypothetical protein